MNTLTYNPTQEKNNDMFVLSNSNVEVRYQERYFDFTVNDKTDQYNLPRAFNQTKRTHKKAWAALRASFNDSTTFYKVLDILEENGIRMHSYCAMD